MLCVHCRNDEVARGQGKKFEPWGGVCLLRVRSAKAEGKVKKGRGGPSRKASSHVVITCPYNAQNCPVYKVARTKSGSDSTGKDHVFSNWTRGLIPFDSSALGSSPLHRGSYAGSGTRGTP
eukprot:2097877-Rhodomonas_salina.2